MPELEIVNVVATADMHQQVDLIQISQLDYTIHDEKIYGARAERPTEPSPWRFPIEHSTISRDQLDEYLDNDYEIHEWITNEIITVKKVGTGRVLQGGIP